MDKKTLVPALIVSVVLNIVLLLVVHHLMGKGDSTQVKINNLLEEELEANKKLYEKDKQIARFEEHVLFVESNITKLKKEKDEIKTIYAPVYEKINDAHDSVQFAITQELLAKHRQLRLQRD